MTVVSGMVLVDYCKAFDMIDHTLLLKKLEVYGLGRDSLQWCTSYLKDERQLVKGTVTRFCACVTS